MSAVLLALTGSAADFHLVENGRACARLELVAEDSDRQAAERDITLFNRYLQKVTGVSLSTDGSPVRTMKIVVKPVK
jgi:hypothetical protein